MTTQVVRIETRQLSVRIQERAGVTGVRVANNGPKGDRGDNFQPDATGLFATRGTYDAQPVGFAFLATDTADLYFRETATAGVWSAAVPFGGAGGGGGVVAYVHDQASASFVWTINHNLGYYPSVELFDSGSQEFNGHVSHPTVNQAVVTLTTSTSGFARLL